MNGEEPPLFRLVVGVGALAEARAAPARAARKAGTIRIAYGKPCLRAGRERRQRGKSGQTKGRHGRPRGVYIAG